MVNNSGAVTGHSDKSQKLSPTLVNMLALAVKLFLARVKFTGPDGVYPEKVGKHMQETNRNLGRGIGGSAIELLLKHPLWQKEFACILVRWQNDPAFKRVLSDYVRAAPTSARISYLRCT